MKSSRMIRIAGALLTPLAVVGALALPAGPASANVAWHGRHTVLFVSKQAHSSNADRSCRTAAFTTIQSAVHAAPAGGTVVVCRGIYHEQVVVTKPLSLQGRRATINERHVTPTLVVNPPGIGPLTIFAGVVILSSHVDISGFTIRNAQGEGILAAGVTGTIRDISITQNAVEHNDLGGGVPPASTYFECAAMGQIPGDCGEGIHFLAVAYSTIRGNFISDNSGGVLLTDETGPTHHNTVESNIVTNNASDCGITVPGHNPHALSAAGVPQPSVAGVYDNVIRNNVVTDNGQKGEGAGVLFANAGPGTASYNNLVEGNYIAGNELSGVTLHAHTLGPGQFEDLSGNTVTGNVIGTNNTGGDPLDSPAPPQDPLTTGVLVFSGGTPIAITVAHNVIFSNAI
ncbi:MAG TPA: right-handed parallel beta-helix repeat-containing protein, partial [Streptosporangiaceae bacterium]